MVQGRGYLDRQIASVVMVVDTFLYDVMCGFRAFVDFVGGEVERTMFI